ncbi:hypothetical protein DRF65_08660 [Chryseobacterium pennae]|uniref:Uncharacterized protein n=1 Tax=Chryseobacterium pennae TaxID=2258962 RepID=A0A3D9CBL3_9FLAO|nr:hypothetical protein [Chryseobacterium pennae]REC62882.1 hypothetical protein DRF65_08660 [Chryseobacterium pennae]
MTQKQLERFLLFLNIICLLLILNIKFFHLSLVNVDFTAETIKTANDIIYNLATSIIASYIFYVINIQIVSYYREKKTQKLISGYLSDILQQINIGQAYLRERYFENIDFKTLKLSNFDNLHTLKNNDEIAFSYERKNELGNTIACSTGTFTELDLFIEEKKLVRKNIDIIFSFPYAISLDYDLVRLLYKIQSCYFYIGISNIKDGIKYSNFEKHFFEHYENIKELEKIINSKSTLLRFKEFNLIQRAKSMCRFLNR